MQLWCVVREDGEPASDTKGNVWVYQTKQAAERKAVGIGVAKLAGPCEQLADDVQKATVDPRWVSGCPWCHPVPEAEKTALLKQIAELVAKYLELVGIHP